MGDYGYLRDKDMAKKTLDLLEDTIIGCQPRKSGPGLHQGFHNDDVILMIKLWEKAIILRLGFSDRDWAVYTSNREPPKLAAGQKRSEVLLRAIDVFTHNLDNLDWYHQAQQAMLNFVLEYRMDLTDVNDRTDFVTTLSRVVKAGPQGLADEPLLDEELALKLGD
jgi:hypothetical protein